MRYNATRATKRTFSFGVTLPQQVHLLPGISQPESSRSSHIPVIMLTYLSEVVCYVFVAGAQNTKISHKTRSALSPPPLSRMPTAPSLLTF